MEEQVRDAIEMEKPRGTTEKPDGQLSDVLAENSERILTWVLAIAVLLSIVVAGAYVVRFGDWSLAEDTEKWAQFGDYLGGVLNPIFGFLSVFALLVALVLQTRELRLSREALKVSQEELKATREEQAKSAEALEEQNKAIRKQSFEQTFFSLLRLLGEVRDACTAFVIGVPTSSGAPRSNKLEGVSAISHRLNSYFKVDMASKAAPPMFPDTIREGVTSLLADNVYDLIHFAKTVQAILEYLQEADIGSNQIYPRIMKNQLSQTELRLLYYLCFSDTWSALKHGAEKYGLLANLNPNQTGAGVDYASFFDRRAFAS